MKLRRYSLPFPPSTHGLFRGGRFKGDLNERYRKWRDEAGWMLLSQGVERFNGPVAIRVELRAPDRRPRDGDNFVKGPIDLLVKHGVIASDDNRFVRESTAAWSESGEPCVIEIREIAA